MSKREPDEVTGVETTGHEWDGIRELDNPLPRWWLWVFYASIAVSIVYWVLMPAWPGINVYTKGVLGQSDRQALVGELASLDAVRGAQGARLKTASLEEIERDPDLQAYAQAVGQSVFGDNCATCHGTGGVGTKGYANLRDDVWLWGGELADIHRTIQVGVRSGAPDARFSQMPAFGRDQMLTPAQVDDLTEFVVALSHRPADLAAVRRAAPVYVAQCVSCHGVKGLGDQKQGAPNLTDQEWLYGSGRQAIHDQIWNGQGGVMPAWKDRFDPETLKALAVYIHANAGGR
ncbi:cytochrome-c oxidase, cbb3-type subunit III [Phenylobacterium sp.]|uniref:cytochrome-c oxidase, cbb3-type subunit III n=1 Tax=Phenylobacterium sp. TaxID=1871053 RepID=UPI00286BB2DB|nr:cytochrome-c oxidase, cbb3-type subunit III [Phenylobacterium sp.]